MSSTSIFGKESLNYQIHEWIHALSWPLTRATEQYEQRTVRTVHSERAKSADESGESGRSKRGRVDGRESERPVESGRSRVKVDGLLTKSGWAFDGMWTVLQKVDSPSKSVRSWGKADGLQYYIIDRTNWGSTNRFGQTLNAFVIKMSNVPRFSCHELEFIRKRFLFLEIS